jgi:hypothetical protein
MSEKFVYEIDLTGDKKLESSLRKSMSVWAALVPNHPYKKLGDIIQVEHIFYKPAYPVRLQSQFEERGRHEGHEPFTGQKIPERVLFKLNDFTSWNIELPVVNDFTDSSINYIVNGSQHIENCFKCDAKGWITCVTCYGAKKLTCPQCRGVGESDCDSCSGGGSLRCYNCNGSGTIRKQLARSNQVWIPERYDSNGYKIGNTGMYEDRTYYETVNESCSYCNGRGKTSCRSCGGNGKISCQRCGASGKITCGTCSGSGRNTCPTCNGRQQLLHYFYVQRDLSCTDQKTCVIHGEVYDRFPQFLEEYEQYESNNQLSKLQKRIETGQLPEDNHLNEFIDKYIINAHQEATDIHSLIFQQLDVERIDAWEMHYSFKGKNYIMLFVGSDYQVIPGLSPVYEVSFELWSRAVAAANARLYTRSRRLLKKAESIGTFEIQDDLEDALDIVEAKISDSYRLGTLVGALLSAFLGGFLAYNYFADVNYVLDYVSFINRDGSWLYGYHAPALTITFIVLLFIGYRKLFKLWRYYGNAVPSATVRILFSALSMILLSALVLSALILLNITGITILLSFALWLILWLVKILVFLVVLLIQLVIWLAKALWWVLKGLIGLFT